MADFDPDAFLATLPAEPVPASAPPKQSAIGKVTSFGYRGDEFTDSNSRNRIGAWDNRLSDESLAVSPDIEKQFRAAGIKPRDPVTLTLADGSTVTKRWDDRTASDSTAKKLGLPPLRGRFDFFTPTGVHDRDGQGVMSFSAAQPPREPDRSTEALAARLGPLPTEDQIIAADPTPLPGTLAVAEPEPGPALAPRAAASDPIPFSPQPSVAPAPDFSPLTDIPEGVSLARVGEPPQADFDPDAFLASTETVAPVFDPDEFLAATAPAPNPLQPLTRDQFAEQWRGKQNRPLSQKAEALAEGIGAGAGNAVKTIAGGMGEMIGNPSRIPATLLEGAARGTFDFLDLARRAGNSDARRVLSGMAYNPAMRISDPQMRDSLAAVTGAMPEEQRIDRDYAKYLNDFGYDAERAQGRDQRGNLVPQIVGQPLPSASEAASYVLDPSVVLPVVGQGGKIANIGRKVASRALAPAAEVTEKAAGAVGRGVKAVGEKALETAAKAGVSPEAAKGTAAVAGAGSLLTGPGQAAAATLGTAKATEAAAQAAGAVAGEVLADSQLRIAERIARDVSKPAWLRRSAATLAKLPPGVTGTLGAAVEGAAQGAAIGGGLAALTDRGPEEIGAGLGSGGLLGAGGAAFGYNLPNARRSRQQRAEDGDMAWAVIRQEQLGGSAGRVATLPRQQRLQIASLQRIFDDSTDIVFLDRPSFDQATGGQAARGVYRQQGPEGRPRIFIDLDTPGGPVGALAHEVVHSMVEGSPRLREAAHLAIDQGYGPDRLQAMGMEYARRQLEAEAGRRPPPLPVDWWPGKTAGKPPPLSRISPIERSAVEARYGELRDSALAAGDADGLGWIRNEVLAEHFRAELDDKPWNLSSLRKGLPPGADPGPLREYALGIKAGILGALGVKFDQTGKLAAPQSSLFRDNPLLADPAMRRMVGSLMHDRFHWLRGLQRVERADTPHGVPLVPRGQLAVLATSPAVQWRRVGNGWETDFATRDATGRVRLKSPADIAAIEKARQDGARMIVPGDRLAVDDPRVGRKMVDGKAIIAGATLPPQFDLLPGFPAEVKQAARALEAARDGDGGTFSTWYHQIGTGADGSWRQSVRSGLGNLAATQRELSLVGWEISKAGNVVGKMLDVSAARARAIELHGEGRLGLWGGDLNNFSGDVRTYLANHAAGRPGETGIGTAKRDFINGFFGVSTKANQRANPVYSGEFGRSLIKSFRLDRMNNPQPTGRTGWAIDYPKLRDNLMPSPGAHDSPFDTRSPGAQRRAMPEDNRAAQPAAAPLAKSGGFDQNQPSPSGSEARAFYELDAAWLHGGPAELRGGALQRFGKGSTDMGALFLVKDSPGQRNYAAIHDKGAIYRTRVDLPPEEVFDLRDPSHRERVAAVVSDDANGNDFLRSAMPAAREGVLDWSTLDEDVLRAAGFRGAIITERPAGIHGNSEAQLSLAVFDPSAVRIEGRLSDGERSALKQSAFRPNPESRAP